MTKIEVTKLEVIRAMFRVGSLMRLLGEKRNEPENVLVGEAMMQAACGCLAHLTSQKEIALMEGTKIMGEEMHRAMISEDYGPAEFDADNEFLNAHITMLMDDAADKKVDEALETVDQVDVVLAIEAMEKSYISE
jgi:hypothetical protein